MELPRLRFPDYKFKLRTDTPDGQSLKIFDIIRGKFISLTPEEWVRQHLIHFLVHERGYPATLLGVEKKVLVNRLERRFDLLVYSRDFNPVLLAECKSPSVSLNQDVFDQAARYNLTLGAKYFVLSNGMETICCTIDHEKQNYQFIEEVPFYDKL